MVKKFKEFIEEGFLSKTLNRAKTGELRKEESALDIIFNVFKEWHKDHRLNFQYGYDQLKLNKEVLIPRDEWDKLVSDVHDKLSKLHLCEDITSQFERPNFDYASSFLKIVDNDYCIVYSDANKKCINVIGQTDDTKYYYIMDRHYTFNDKHHASCSKYERDRFIRYNTIKSPFYKVFKLPNDFFKLLYDENDFHY
ncbi:MAG: hypothetical protein NC548_27445 [Lachnospiraceae bacterium]|nr:hypothetical protein [Lachnospiraceae bacterium]